MKTAWKVIAGIAVGLVVAFLMRRSPWRQVKKEFEAIEAARVAERALLNQGAALTRKRIETQHADTIRRFDDAQKAKVESLRDDPVGLARWLTRHSS